MTTRTTGPAGGQDDLSAVERSLQKLSPAECFALLEPGGVGRVGFPAAEGIVILPVNFAVAGKTIIVRTAPDTQLAVYGNARLSFQTDYVDEARRAGWSVLVQGHAHTVTNEREVRRLEQAGRPEPWADGARDVYLRITPAHISGRRIQLGPA